MWLNLLPLYISSLGTIGGTIAMVLTFVMVFVLVKFLKKFPRWKSYVVEIQAGNKYALMLMG